MFTFIVMKLKKSKWSEFESEYFIAFIIGFWNAKINLLLIIS